MKEEGEPGNGKRGRLWQKC